MTPSSYRYSRSTTGTTLAVALVLIVAPYIPGWSHRPGVWTYSVCWVLGCAVLLLALYFFFYRVTVNDGRFTIREFAKREFALIDIASVDLRPRRGGAFAEVRLRNGDVVNISGELDGFANLVAALMLKDH